MFSTCSIFIVFFFLPVSYLNILTDFADAEIFLIDGDSLLLELLEETTLDWTNGGQFLHLTYLVECFLQYFTDKGKPTDTHNLSVPHKQGRS